MSSLQLSIAFSKHQVTEYSVTQVDLDKKLKYLEIIVEHFFIIILLSFLICKKIGSK